ncbi:MAG TPA: hypothetical protein VJQ51_00005, partial [Burkholderiales bacterium]|nr:hypothetical protein [Burkholderiales bacterium]
NDGLSDGQRTVYEFVGDDKRSVSRIQGTAEGGITRLESWYGGTLSAFMEVTSREVDRPIAEADLMQEVPLLTRYSYRNAPVVFIAGLFVVTIIAGIAFWTWLFARAEAFEGAMRIRSRLWRYFAGAFILIASVLVLLAVATRGGSGHPPAIVYVMVMAVLAGIAFALMACFLLSSYAGQALAQSRRPR